MRLSAALLVIAGSTCEPPRAPQVEQNPPSVTIRTITDVSWTYPEIRVVTDSIGGAVCYQTGGSSAALSCVPLHK